MYKNITTPCTYQVEFFIQKVPTSDSAKIYPLKKIDETGYWSIKKENVPENSTFKESISVYRQNRTPIDSTEHPVIIYFNDLLKKWSVIATSTNGFSSKFITTIPTELKNGYITFGSLASQVLPIEKIYLTYSLQNIYLNLIWINYTDAETAYYEVTYSNDGKFFTTLKNIYPKMTYK